MLAMLTCAACASASCSEHSGSDQAVPHASQLRKWQQAFDRDGFVVIPGFSSPEEVGAMLASMEEMVDSWWRAELANPADAASSVFTTGENQTQAQARSKYFFDSATGVHFFREASEAPTDGSSTSTVQLPALNKVGHGLHLNSSTPFGKYAQSQRVAAVVRAVAGMSKPVLPQSMYIFKEAKVGGPVTSHQDGTFLYTRPHQTVVGLWLALHDAHEANGCLWARPSSHLEPLRRRFVRTVDAEGEIVMSFVNASSAHRESFFATPAGHARSRSPFARARQWLARTVHRMLPRCSADRQASVIARSETAREWEGTFPAADATVADAAILSDLHARGFVPLAVRAGDLVVLAGTLDHLSLANASPHRRHTFQLHAVEGPEAGIEWASENWLQVPDSTHRFLRL